MDRQDHAQEPLLRRIIRRIPPPNTDTDNRVELIDFELSSGFSELTDLQGATALVTVRIHGQTLGVVEIPCPAGKIPQHTLRTAARSQLGWAWDEHLRSDGLESLDA